MKESAPSTAEDDSSSSSTSSKKKRGLGHLAAGSSERLREERAAEEKVQKEEPRRRWFEKPEPAPEQTAPLETVSTNTEQPRIVRALAGERAEAVGGEVTDGSPEAEAAKAAAAEFYAAAERTGDPDAAYQAASEVTGASAEAVSTANIESDFTETAGEAAETADIEMDETIDESDATETADWEEEVVFDRTTEAHDDAETDEADDTATTAAGTPPRPPFIPFGGTPYGPGNFGPSGGGPNFGGGFNPNFAPPVAARANVAPSSPDYDVGNPAVTALIGGIVGYLIGRRRGRIKTEKRLLPIQKKLEKQVVNLDWQLQEKEAKIRRQAMEQVRLKGVMEAERIRQAAADRRQQRQREREQPVAERTTVIERRPAPEAHQLHGNKRQEHLGQVLLAAEAPLLARSSKTAETSAGIERIDKKQAVTTEAVEATRSINQHTETLNRAELLGISEKIVVGGSTLRQIYESHLVGERGLRRLVEEHLRGGDLKKALRREIVEREIDFERDPAMRDLGAGSTASAVQGSGKTVLDTMLQQAEVGLSTGKEEAAFYKARAKYEAVQHEQEQKQRRIIDVSLTVAIVSLLSAVIYLFITRG